MKLLRGLVYIFILFLLACNSKQPPHTLQDSAIIKTDTLLRKNEQDSISPSVSLNSSLNPNPNSILITCDGVGKITFDDTYEDLLRKAGAKQVKSEPSVVNGTAQKTLITKVWKGTTGELTINWQETKEPYQTIQNIIIDQPYSTYVLENGIKIGSKMSLVNKLNGKSFMLFGFKGPNAGILVNFNGGNLITQIPCVRAVFEMPKMKSYPKEVAEVLIPGMVQSDHIAFKIYDPTLKKLIINAKR